MRCLPSTFHTSSWELLYRAHLSRWGRQGIVPVWFEPFCLWVLEQPLQLRYQRKQHLSGSLWRCGHPSGTARLATTPSLWGLALDTEITMITVGDKSLIRWLLVSFSPWSPKARLPKRNTGWAIYVIRSILTIFSKANLNLIFVTQIYPEYFHCNIKSL